MRTSPSLPAEPSSVRVARRWVTEALDDLGCGELADPVVLLVSELVSNAVQHAGTPCTVTLEVEGAVRVEVRDGSSTLPELVDASDPLAVSGRGLHLVHSLSSACGADLLPDGGKRVWFEVPAPAPATASAPPTSATA